MNPAYVGISVSPILNYLIPRFLNYCVDEIGLVRGFKSELENLARTLKTIDGVLHDAENRQEGDLLVRQWLEELEDVAYDAEDFLDVIKYQDRRQSKRKKVISCLPSITYDYSIAHEIKRLNERLDRITKDMKKFNFVSQLGGKSASGSGITTVINEIRAETSMHINDSAALVGRKDDISKVIDLLVDSSQDSYCVVRIVGMGGIGKTTLAQMVLEKLAAADDDDKQEDPFSVKKWVSMYGKSKPKEIFLDLLGPNFDLKTNSEHRLEVFDREASLNDIEYCLKQKLMVSKCLIVLDDVWLHHGINISELLKDILSVSGQGSKILITMRSAEEIIPKVGHRYKTYQLQGLDKDECWSMIKKNAFGHGGAEETTDLINIGKLIANKCGGLPLAAKTLGGLLYSKKSKEEWTVILDSQIWSLPAESKIISVLKLSYDHLSPYVKRCFSYCSIFLKGHAFSKKTLIRMWMAEGFLVNPCQPDASPETIGNEYFTLLLHNFFFQDEIRNKFGDTRSCRMHDLVHDLAVSTSGNKSRIVNISVDGIQEQSVTFRRLGFQVLDYVDTAAIPTEICKASKKLRTFVHSGSWYAQFNCNWAEKMWAKQMCTFSLLRVLSLSETGLEELPPSVCTLKHLRYLDVSLTGISTFPSSFSQLINLQTLRIKGGHICCLRELPQDMRKLAGLEYLMFSSYKMTGMPREVSRLTELKKLSSFMVGQGKGYGIEELKDLNVLGGKLVIRNLESVTVGMQANLLGKKNLTHLQLWWASLGGNDPARISKDAEVINDLQPHPNLKKLGIFSFGGLRFPTWMMSASLYLPNLISITLGGCHKCEHLPALGGLRFLRYLSMKGFEGIKQIGNEFYQRNEGAAFPSLVELYLIHFSNLEEWLGDEQSSTSSFPSLQVLVIRHCSKLSITPTEFPSLEISEFSFARQVDPNLKSLPQKLLRGVVQSLLVSGCKSFEGFLPDDEEEQQHGQPHLSSNHLFKMEILRCPSFVALPADFFKGLNSLTYIAIEGCSSLKVFPDGMQYLPALETLIIGGFSEDLASFPFPAATGSHGEHYFGSLRELQISGWPTLRTVLPDHLQLLTSLQRFTIKGFPWLCSLPEWFGELSSLQILGIENCSRLKNIPTEGQMLRLTSLQVLNIKSCPLLHQRCRLDNEEWCKISHLKQVNISSPSSLDDITRDADMKLELAHRSLGVFSNQNREKCWIDSRSGHKSLMLFPRSFNIAWEHVGDYWIWISVTEPSASGDTEIEVPRLVGSCCLGVHGVVDMSKLTPGVQYELVFVVELDGISDGRLDTPVDLCLVLPDGQRLVQKMVLGTIPKSQWIELHVGDFQTPQQPGDVEKEITFSLCTQQGFEWDEQVCWSDLDTRYGFLIEGAVVRPKK